MDRTQDFDDYAPCSDPHVCSREEYERDADREMAEIEREASDGDYVGDTYTRCPHHPSQIISNGMFDAPCGACEAEGDAAYERAVEARVGGFCAFVQEYAHPCFTAESFAAAKAAEADPIPF